MSMRCEDVRPLLAELVYEEVDPGVAEKLRDHLGSCLSCRRHQMAFLAVREDLDAWQPAEAAAPHGITFIAPGAHARASLLGGRWTQRLAIAAGLVFAIFLTAAAVNLRVQSAPDGWMLSTSFSDRGLSALSGDADKPDSIPVDQVHKLDSYLDAYLDTALEARGVAYNDALPSAEDLTPVQWRLVEQRATELARDRATEIVTLAMEERDAQYEMFLTDMLAARLGVHAQEVNDMIVGLIETMEERRAEAISDAVFELMTEHYDTARKIDEAHSRIDNLDNLVTSAVSAPVERRNPEQ